MKLQCKDGPAKGQYFDVPGNFLENYHPFEIGCTPKVKNLSTKPIHVVGKVYQYRVRIENGWVWLEENVDNNYRF